MALSGTERSRRCRAKQAAYVAEHRARKAALAFSTEYLKGISIATPEQFIEAKAVEFEDKHGVFLMAFHDSLTNEFYTQLKEYSSEDGSPLYIIDELMEAWTIAEKECEANC